VLENQRVFAASSGRPVLEPAEWTGELIRDGVYIKLRASSRQLLVDAAKALEPMP
jgi:hypothetical protein